MESCEKNRTGGVILILLILYVILLGFATLDDIMGWGILAPLFSG